MAIRSVQPISTLDLPELAPYRTMRLQAEHRRQRIFVAEGEKVVRRLIESDLGVVSVLLPTQWLEALRPLLERRPENLPVYTADKPVLEQLTGYSMYQGLLAIGRVPAMPTLAEVLAATSPPRLLVALDELANAENLGAVVRNCVAFGTQALLVGETCSSPYLRRAPRGSMGTVFRLPVIETDSLVAALAQLRAAGVRSVAAHPLANRCPLAQTQLAGDCCLVLGNEGHGLSPAVLAACDACAAIPMAAGVDSLNVGSAAAVFLYETCRQRGRM